MIFYQTFKVTFNRFLNVIGRLLYAISPIRYA